MVCMMKHIIAGKATFWRPPRLYSPAACKGKKSTKPDGHHRVVQGSSLRAVCIADHWVSYEKETKGGSGRFRSVTHSKWCANRICARGTMKRMESRVWVYLLIADHSQVGLYRKYLETIDE